MAWRKNDNLRGDKMKKTIYMIICILLNIAAIIVFRKEIVITSASIGPISFMIILGFWCSLYNNLQEYDMTVNTGASMSLTPEEGYTLGKAIGAVSFGIITVLIPFVFFFNDTVKVIVPVSLLISVVFIGTFYFRIRYGKQIKSRIELEEKEREEQEKKESGQ